MRGIWTAATVAIAGGAAWGASGGAALADNVSDTIESALAAYGEGDLAYAEEELTFAIQLLKQMRAASLSGFLPDPLDGWTKEDDPDAAAGLAIMGGSGAAATYSNGEDAFSLTIMVDSPMIASLGAMVSNPAMAAASGGEMIRIGREKFVRNDRQTAGLISNRALISAEGADADAIRAHLETMDFEALADFGD